MPILLQLQKLQWKGDEGWTKSVFASFLAWSEDREFVEFFLGGGIPKHEQQVIAYFQTHYDNVPQKMPLTLAVSNLQIHCHRLPLWRKYTSEVKAAKGLLSDAGQNSRELTTLPELLKAYSPIEIIIPNCVVHKLKCTSSFFLAK